MPKRTLAVALMLFVWTLARGVAQHSGTTNLVLRVGPEARLDPNQVVLHFRVSADGNSDVTTQAANLAAWVRALPGQRIRITAQLASLEGPDGPAAVSAVRWSGSALNAVAGARQAGCTGGVFGQGLQDLVQGWVGSGGLTCALKFDLTPVRDLQPGLYTGVVNLAVSTL